MATKPAVPAVPASAAQMTGQPNLFPDSIPTGPDPLANHIVQDPGFVDVDVDEIRHDREASLRKNNKLADAYTASSSMAKMEEEEEQRKQNKKPNDGYLASDTLFGFEGRINRKKFWLSSLFYGMVSSFVLMVGVFGYSAIMYMLDIDPPKAGQDSLGDMIMVLGPMFMMMLIMAVMNTWVSLALHAKRYHDLGYSGTRILIGLIPFIGGIWVFVECGFFPGQAKKNQYGPDPLRRPTKILGSN